MMRRALYPGSFDPPTLGHLDIILRATRLFDEVIVGVVVNPNKQALLTPDVRVELLQALLAEEKNVRVTSFHGLLMDFARAQGVHALIRGLRSGADYDYELPMILMNRQLAPAVETVLLVGDQRFTHVSSSLVKEVFRFGGSITAHVPALVEARMCAQQQAAAVTSLPQ